MHKNIIIPLNCQCGLFIQHVCLKIHLCIMKWFFTSFDITWYAEAAIYAKTLLFSLWNWQSVTNLNGVKNAIIKWHNFWMVPYLICYFFVILFYIERKWLLMRMLFTILPLKSKLSGKFNRFNAINRNIKMLKIVEFSKISIKTKNFKIFYKAQTANHLKEIIQPPPIPPLTR